jgi:hypothetical protein
MIKGTHYQKEVNRIEDLIKNTVKTISALENEIKNAEEETHYDFFGCLIKSKDFIDRTKEDIEFLKYMIKRDKKELKKTKLLVNSESDILETSYRNKKDLENFIKNLTTEIMFEVGGNTIKIDPWRQNISLSGDIDCPVYLSFEEIEEITDTIKNEKNKTEKIIKKIYELAESDNYTKTFDYYLKEAEND